MRELSITSPRTPGAELLHRLSADGYLFFRALIDPMSVLEARRQVLDALETCGWLTEDSTLDSPRPSHRVRREEANADPGYFEAYTAIQRIQAFHELAHTEPLLAAMTSLVGAPLLVHPRKIARIGLPRDEFVVGAHQDFPLNQGSADVLTAWVPLGDCPDEMGGLRILPGSHRRGLWPVEAVPNVGGLRVVERVENETGWLTTDFAAGDVLVFHSLTVHAAKYNHTDLLRLSADYRYQAASDPVVRGSLEPHYFGAIPGYDRLTESWTSTDAIAAPANLKVVAPFDPIAGPDEPIHSRLVEFINP